MNVERVKPFSMLLKTETVCLRKLCSCVKTVKIISKSIHVKRRGSELEEYVH